MNISAWSIRRPLPAILVFILLTAAGLLAFNKLAVSQFPDLTVPVVNVTVTLPGASPSTLETQVTRKVEDAVASIADIKNLYSIVNEGVSTTVIEFDINRDGNLAKDEVRDAIDRVRIDLPADVEPPIVQLINIAGADIIMFAVTADGWSDEELSWYIDDAISKRLFGIPGVGAVRRIGGVDREIRVDLRPGSGAGFRRQPGAAVPATGPDPAGTARRAHHGRRQRAGRAHPGHGGKGRRPGELPDLRARRPQRAAVHAGRRHRWHRPGGADHHPGRQAGDWLRGAAHRGFKRGRRRPGSARERAPAATRAAAPAHRRGRLDHRGRRELLRILDAHALRGRTAGRGRGVLVPARLARHLHLGRGPAAVHHPDVCGDVLVRLQPQHDHVAGAGRGGRHPGRRCDRGGGEHRPPPADGQEPARCGDGGRRRDRAGSDRDLLHAGACSSRCVHAGHPRQVLPRVRLDRRRGGAVLAAGGAPDHADDGRLHAQADARAQGGFEADAVVPALGGQGAAPSRPHPADGAGPVHRLAGAAADPQGDFHPAHRRHPEHAAGGAAAGHLAAHHPAGRRGGAPAHRGHARAAARVHHRRQRQRLGQCGRPVQRRGAQGHADPALER
jgi:Cation/multidrug efflux pump